MDRKNLYFDHAATTPVSRTARTALLDALDQYGNPSSLHKKGLEAERLMVAARREIAAQEGVKPDTIVFTSGGTEANNLAIFGVTRQYENRGKHIVTTAIEHPAVLEPLHFLLSHGFDVTFVPPDKTGDISSEAVLNAVRDDTILVSVMHVNNEIGTILPISEIGLALKSHRKTLFHVDGTQAVGKLPFQIGDLPVDLYTLSGHKLGTPKGIGALYVRDGVVIQSLIFGGGQEVNRRSGTENTPYIAALAAAIKERKHRCKADLRHVSALQSRLAEGISGMRGWKLIRPRHQSPYILAAAHDNLPGEVLVHGFEMEGLYVSTGSACSARDARQGSHVLLAMDCPSEIVRGAIRFSLSSEHTKEDIDEVLRIVEEQTSWLKNMM